jgi:succinate dehydrogenase hydrophobic anchor subunit
VGARYEKPISRPLSGKRKSHYQWLPRLSSIVFLIAETYRVGAIISFENKTYFESYWLTTQPTISSLLWSCIISGFWFAAVIAVLPV